MPRVQNSISSFEDFVTVSEVAMIEKQPLKDLSIGGGCVIYDVLKSGEHGISDRPQVRSGHGYGVIQRTSFCIVAFGGPPALALTAVPYGTVKAHSMELGRRPFQEHPSPPVDLPCNFCDTTRFRKTGVS